jgi:hypothetical protein
MASITIYQAYKWPIIGPECADLAIVSCISNNPIGFTELEFLQIPDSRHFTLVGYVTRVCYAGMPREYATANGFNFTYAGRQN